MKHCIDLKIRVISPISTCKGFVLFNLIGLTHSIESHDTIHADTGNQKVESKRAKYILIPLKMKMMMMTMMMSIYK